MPTKPRKRNLFIEKELEKLHFSSSLSCRRPSSGYSDFIIPFPSRKRRFIPAVTLKSVGSSSVVSAVTFQQFLARMERKFNPYSEGNKGRQGGQGPGSSASGYSSGIGTGTGQTQSHHSSSSSVTGSGRASTASEPGQTGFQHAQVESTEWQMGFGRGRGRGLGIGSFINQEQQEDDQDFGPCTQAAYARREVQQQPLSRQAGGFYGLTEAYLEREAEINSKGRCKLPSTYGQGIYENKPDWVEEDKPNTEQMDDTDWSDGTGVPVALAEVPKVVAGPNCNFFLAPGEKMLQCPYDDGHQILELRFQRHLVKCRTNYLKQRKQLGKRVEIGICLYNGTHHIKESLMAEHLENCPTHLDLLEHEARQEAAIRDNPGMINTTPMFSPKQEVTGNGKKGSSSVNTSFVKSESESGTPDRKMGYTDSEIDKDWELAEPVKAYDPSIKLQKGVYFMNPQGLTYSERKEFRENERVRICEMEAKLKKEKEEIVEKNRMKLAPDQFLGRNN